jgi:hypothetical protein
MSHSNYILDWILLHLENNLWTTFILTFSIPQSSFRGEMISMAYPWKKMDRTRISKRNLDSDV